MLQIWGNYYRYLLATVAFLCLISVYSNLSAINFTSICLDEDDLLELRPNTNISIYNYTSVDKKYINWALGFGTIAGTFPINYLYVKHGARITFLCSGIISMISTAFIPLAAGYDFRILLVARFFQGLAYAADFGVIGIIITRWAPSDETTFFLAFLTSFSPFAMSICYYFSSLICLSNLGWRWVYYFHAIFTFIIFTFWALIYHDNPSESNRLSKIELSRIQKNKSVAELDTKAKIPYFKLLTSPVVWTIWLNAFFEITTIVLLSVYLPVYFKEVLKFDVSDVANNIATILFISEYWKINISNLIAVGLAGASFGAIGFVPPEKYPFSVILCFLTCAFCVFNCAGFYKCAALHSRQFAHFVISTCQFMKCVALFVAPALVAFFVSNESDRLQWIPVFLVLGISSIVGAGYLISKMLQKTLIYLGSLINNFLLIYLVILKSPESLGSYKKLMITISIFEIFYAIVNYFGEVTLYSHTHAIILFTKIEGDYFFGEKMLYTMLVLYSFCYGASMGFFSILFVYRYLVASNNQNLLHNFFSSLRFLIWLIIPITFGIAWVIGDTCFINDDYRNLIAPDILKNCKLTLKDIVYTGSFLFYVYNNYSDVFPTIIFAAVMMISLFTILYFGIKCYKIIQNIEILKQLSKNNRILQVQLFYALFLQTIVPILLIHLPTVFYLSLSMFSIHSKYLAKVTSLTISIFPLLDPLPTILIIKEYRQGLFDILKLPFNIFRRKLRFVSKLFEHLHWSLAIFTLLLAYFMYRVIYLEKKKRRLVRLENIVKDRIYLYRGKQCSPNSLKLEVIMRVHKIDYEIIETNRADGIELGGDVYQDPDVIDMILRNKFKIPEFSKQQEMRLTAISRVAEHFEVTLEKMYYKPFNPFPSRRKPNPFLNEQVETLKRDLKAVEHLLMEDQKFAVGDQLSFADATIFGQVMIYPMDQYLQITIDADYPKIRKLLTNVRNQVYPDGFI